MPAIDDDLMGVAPGLVDQRIDRVLIMLPGLNELDHIAHYDQIGRHLADHGVAAILHPLPDHLWRHARHRLRDRSSLTPWQMIYKKPLTLFSSYIQLMYELRSLCHHIRGIQFSYCDDHPNCRFFRDVFAPDTRVSILGYSLGGLGAIAYFLTSQEGSAPLTSCFLLNAGAALRDINPEAIKISKTDWDDTVRRLTSALLTTPDPWETLNQEVGFEQLLKRDGINASKNINDGASPDQREFNLFYRVFMDAFLEANPQALHAAVQPHNKRIFIIAGGGDHIIGYDAIRRIEPAGSGLTVLKIPQMPHLLTRSPEWEHWLIFIVNAIISLEEQATRVQISEVNVIAKLRSVQEQSSFPIFQRTSVGGKHIYRMNYEHVPVEERDSFYRYYYAGIANHDEDDLAKKVLAKWRAGALAIEVSPGLEERVIRRSREAHPDKRVLQALLADGHIDEAQVTEVLSRQRHRGILPGEEP